jgi:hypothetical protein
MAKLAFSTSQYSTPLNPDIRSGASVLPPFKAPQLRTAIQKNSGAVTPMVGPGNGDLTKAGMAALLEGFDFLDKLAAMGVGQWWEQVGGPHLAKGGSHTEFKKMMETEGLSPKVQEKFLNLAKEKYKPGFNEGASVGRARARSAGPSPAPAGSLHVPGGAANLAGGALAAGLAGRMLLSDEKDDPNAEPQRWKGRLGAHLMTTVPLGALGYQVGSFSPRAGLIGGLAGAGLGALAGEAALRGTESHQTSLGEQAARSGKRSKDVLRQASKSSAGMGKEMLIPLAPSTLLLGALDPAIAGHLAATTSGVATGAGLLGRYGALTARKAMDEKQKAAASAPTRGNFMMASDLPPFRAPRLDRAIQKNSGETSMPTGPTDNIHNPQPENTSKYAGKLVKLEGDAVIEVDENGKSKGEGNLLQKEQGKEKADAFLPDNLTYSQSDFKRSKYAMSTAELARFVEQLRKEGGAAGLTPAGQLAKTQSVGAPKASPPPGPSIAQIAKPRGARFGVGIPGAFKSTIGGDKGVALK